MDIQQVVQVLQATPETLRALLHGLDPGLHVWKPEPEEWSINEIIGHLIEGDRFAFAERIRLMLAEDGPEIPGVDVNKLAAQRSDNDCDAFALVDELAKHRVDHVQLVLSLNDEQMARTGHFKKYGTFLVSDFVIEWAYHDYAHMQQILENVKAATWPQFSETMQRALGG